MPGIKVDKGTLPLAGSPGELITEGLDGLGQRLAEYYEMGLRFAKWRAVITVGEGIPTPYCIEANAHALARYAAVSQHAGLVPIVEPEVLMDGDHGIDDCYAATKATLQETFAQLARQGVALGGMLLEAQYGGLRFVGIESSGSGNGRGDDGRMFQTDHTGGDAGRRVSLRRTDRQRSDGKPERNQRGGCESGRSVGAQLLVRPGPSERALEGMGRKSRTRPCGPSCFQVEGQADRRRPAGQIHSRDGEPTGHSVMGNGKLTDDCRAAALYGGRPCRHQLVSCRPG